MKSYNPCKCILMAVPCFRFCYRSCTTLILPLTNKIKLTLVLLILLGCPWLFSKANEDVVLSIRLYKTCRNNNIQAVSSSWKISWIVFKLCTSAVGLCGNGFRRALPKEVRSRRGGKGFLKWEQRVQWFLEVRERIFHLWLLRARNSGRSKCKFDLEWIQKF